MACGTKLDIGFRLLSDLPDETASQRSPLRLRFRRIDPDRSSWETSRPRVEARPVLGSSRSRRRRSVHIRHIRALSFVSGMVRIRSSFRLWTRYRTINQGNANAYMYDTMPETTTLHS